MSGAFYPTDLDLVLRTAGVTHLVLSGITTDVFVHTTRREANDRGYEPLLLSDCTGAIDILNYRASPRCGVWAPWAESAGCSPRARLDQNKR